MGGITIVQQGLETENELEEIKMMLINSLNALGLPHHVEVIYNGFDAEFFYLSSEGKYGAEGENILLPKINTIHRTKAYSLGMVYNYPKIAGWKLRFRSKKNKNKRPSLLSFGICTPRILHCLFHRYHDEKGFNLPTLIRPFNVCVIPESEDCLNIANDVYIKLKSVQGQEERVLIDERIKKSVEKRNSFADYLGTPYKIIVRRAGFILLGRNNNYSHEVLNLNDIIKLLDLLRKSIGGCSNPQKYLPKTTQKLLTQQV